jgi:ketosteroid isomerase-like protein
MTVEQAAKLLESIQLAFEKKDLQAALEFYHDDVIFINPAFPSPFVGKEDLKSAFRRNFAGPQRTSMSFKDIRVRELGTETFVVYCRVEGIQTLYLSEKRFAGYLSRVFVTGGGRPLIVHEHFSFRA